MVCLPEKFLWKKKNKFWVVTCGPKSWHRKTKWPGNRVTVLSSIRKTCFTTFHISFIIFREFFDTAIYLPEHQIAQIIIIHNMATGSLSLFNWLSQELCIHQRAELQGIIMHHNIEIAVKRLFFSPQCFLILTSEIAFLKSVDKFRDNIVKWVSLHLWKW